jgi:hypothetical protein
MARNKNQIIRERKCILRFKRVGVFPNVDINIIRCEIDSKFKFYNVFRPFTISGLALVKVDFITNKIQIQITRNISNIKYNVIFKLYNLYFSL